MYYKKRNQYAAGVSIENISDNADSESENSVPNKNENKKMHKNLPSADTNYSDGGDKYGCPSNGEYRTYPMPNRAGCAMPINSAMPGSNYTMPSNNNYPQYDGSKYNSGTSVDREESLRRCDTRLVKQLYTAVNKTLLPYVEAAADEYEYVGSPIYAEDGIDRETLAQLADRVLNLAAADIDDIQEINDENIMRTEWNRKQLLNNAAESLLLNEIFAVRRPKYRRIKDNFVYSSGMYDGVARR